jgi:hypothetical protein
MQLTLYKWSKKGNEVKTPAPRMGRGTGNKNLLGRQRLAQGRRSGVCRRAAHLHASMIRDSRLS